MKERKLTINLIWANIFSVVALVIIVVVTAGLWYVLWGFDDIHPAISINIPNKEFMPRVSINFTKMAIPLILLFVGILVHELIHGITWAHYAKNGWKSISFGVLWKMLTPYCHCNEPLQVRSYIIGGLMPLIIMGIIPWVVGLCIGSFWTTVAGVIFIGAACGDILIVWKLRNEKSTNTVLDHPSEAGCIIYEE